MPLWLIYGCDYLMAFALLIIAALLAIFCYLVVTRQIRLVAVDNPFKSVLGRYATEYFLVIGDPGEVEAAIIERLGKGEAHG